MLVRIIPVGEIDGKLLENVSIELRELFNIRCKVLPKIDLPEEAYNIWRKQYDAEKIIDILSRKIEAKFIDKNIPTLGITEVDIYYNGLNFVFGLEDVISGCSIISIARLKQEFYGLAPSFSLLVDRTVKEIIHALGHQFGLDHCMDPFCVMSFSPSVNDVDRKGKDFCKNCKVKLTTKGISIE
jgi:archaemetzincin